MLAEIPGIAGIGVDTRRTATNTCRESARFTICSRGQEWCPLPAARWRIRLTKLSGPAGVIRFVFMVGRPPR